MNETTKITRVIDGKKVVSTRDPESKRDASDDATDVSIRDWKKILISKILVKKCKDFEAKFKSIDPAKIPNKFSLEIQEFIDDVISVTTDWNEADFYDIKEGRPENEEANKAVIQVISDYALNNAVNGVFKFPSAERVHEELTKINYERIQNKQEEIKVLSVSRCENILKIYRNL